MSCLREILLGSFNYCEGENMNLSTLVESGTIQVNIHMVTDDDTADSLGNTGVKVLSTPRMISLMEKTASEIIYHQLPKGYSPVGTKINVDHINPAFVGETVKIKAVLESIEKNKLTYTVRVFTQDKMIGEGKYEQQIIELNQFLKQ